MKRTVSSLLAMVLLLGLVFAAPQVHAATSPNVNTHTPGEVAAYVFSNSVSIYAPVTYDQTPVTTAPYAPGVLSQETMDSAIALLNAVRYLAGLDAVVHNPAWDAGQQAACIVSAAHGTINHYPEKPADMDDALFQLGYAGCGSSNLSAGRNTLNRSLLSGWMGDSDAYNISHLGHRRWCLYPKMGQVSFGAVTNGTTGYRRFYSMYSFDNSNRDADQSYVVWPGQVMPAVYSSRTVSADDMAPYFATNDAWSISTGKAIPNGALVTVKLERLRDGVTTTWNFGNGSPDGDFFTSNVGYGTPGCIIFRPYEIDEYRPGDTFTVTVSGLSEPFSYTVRFMDLSNPFTDVAPERYYAPTVLWAYYDGIATGMTTTTFEPTRSCTRGQMVTFLYRAMGSPEPADTSVSFTDVAPGRYYSKAVQWAVEQGITNGYSDGTFRPDKTVSRGEAVTFLYRAAGKPPVDTTSTSFTDVPEGRFFTEAVAWAVANGITTGIDSTTFAPDRACIRSEVVTFLYRYRNR